MFQTGRIASPYASTIRRSCSSGENCSRSDTPTETTYAGRSQEERRAQQEGEKQLAQEHPGGPMAKEATEPDKHHSSGDLSDEGKKVWQTGSGIDGSGKT
jgi:hypothetical protein